MIKNNYLNKELLKIKNIIGEFLREKNLNNSTYLRVLKIGVWRLIINVENKTL